ncbi:hypothetical protein FVO59_00160 [Microbacterium esteraromaticum]|uniref:Secreted protein n=1 Tax=Microbacterium esteraromaticum TaxID=57043 RepID=A0A7D7WCC0_9MICO|nr:hypothetical protein [Microbacterium esteraromaticum]QMU95791.1 hypothetical protein FVO59_00160 [Microbacterium esteraromaticum]
MRRLPAVLGIVLAGSIATACAPSFVDACPAIGYIAALQVDASAIPEAAWVQLCDGAICSPGFGEEESVDTQIGVSSQDGVWGFAFLAREPVEHASIRVFGADGALIQETEHNVEWTHSTARCGGPSTADTVMLQRLVS